MRYRLSHTRGSFIIDALSGVDLYQDTSTQHDSKVLLLDAQPCLDESHPSPTPPNYNLVSLNISQKIQIYPLEMNEESLLETITQKSTSFAQKEDAMLKNKEEMEFKRAIVKSLEWKRIHDLEDNSYQEDLEKIMELSKRESESIEMVNDDLQTKETLDLRQAILQSLELKRAYELEDDAYQRDLDFILEQSRMSIT
jgi:hypothetical protein